MRYSQSWPYGNDKGEIVEESKSVQRRLTIQGHDYTITPATLRPVESQRELLQEALYGSLPNTEGSYEGPQVEVAEIKDVAPSCPTECDDDCTAFCHEGHVSVWQREHQPEECPSQES